MSLTILVQEIDTLEAQIAAAQARLQQLRNVERIAGDAIATVQAAVVAVEESAPSALNNLKDIVLSFFPTPTVTVTKTAIEATVEHDEQLSNEAHDVSVDEPEPEFYPDEEPEVEADYLEEPVEDGDIYDGLRLRHFEKQEEQATTVQVAQKITHTSPHGTYEIIKVSDAVSYCRNNREGSMQCAYAGFDSKSRAEQWGKYAIAKNVASGFEVRLATRIEGFKYELKLWGISLKAINNLAERDLTRLPGEDSIQSPVAEEQAREDLGLSEEYYVGDWVKYEDETLAISEIYNDGTLALESSVGTILAHKSEVELAFRKPNNWQPFGAA
ncbi:hypothetical protein F7734_53460 [Scytonema sp. UIC 10036]|uniref:hypothetical protein n=1 Tax=Scytonema sp. UIC 10036 TaxID=2304196 RepID=UPI0012DAA633|nr:hypothetical protein [Scytonema sp. UIC 10036]MUH00617.1 hypothetical protein [Scytonema sp. UIC 10036]